MSRNLLICAAIDLEGGRWFAGCWQRMVASFRLGRAGDILSCEVDGAALAARLDSIPGTENPSQRVTAMPAGADGSFTLLAGRISNRRELAEQFGIALPPDDGELYAAAYRILGDSCDSEIIGEYAVIQWWPQDKKLRLARSALRGPPLHIWREGDRLIAASIPRAIFAAGVTPQIDLEHLADVALRNFSDASRSYYAGLERVECGTAAAHVPGSRKLQRFWSLNGLAPLAPCSREEAVEAVREQMHRAVAAALDGANAPAISLSGGLDSQAVASFALKQIGPAGRLPSFTSVPVEQWLPKPDARLVYDERENIAALAQQYPALQPHFVTGADATTGQDLDKMLLLGSWPTLNEMNMHWIHAIHREAASQGCDVMLHAEFGDSSISYDGLTAFPGWLLRGQWRQLFRQLRMYQDRRSLWRRAVARAVLPVLPLATRRFLDRARGQLASPFETWAPLDPDHPEALAAIERAEHSGHDIHHYSLRDSARARAAMIAAPVSEGPELELALRLLHGVERRDPTAYRPLWELCARLPDDIFLHDGADRWLARELLRDIAPETVRTQRRVGIQSADMLGRIHRDRDVLLGDVARTARNTAAAAVLDTDRMRRILSNCNGPGAEGEKDWLRVAVMVPRGLALARFVRHVEIRNDA